MEKKIMVGSEVRQKIGRGVIKLSEVVRCTLGARGRNVILDREFGSPIICNDGVTIANEVHLDDEFENLGAKLMKEVALNANRDAGDGTTTATVVAEKLISEGFKALASGISPMDMRCGMNEAKDIALDSLSKLSISVSDKLQEVGTISSGDREIGEIISRAFKEVGEDGAITIERSDSHETTLEVKKGMQFSGGMAQHYFANSEDGRSCVLDDCYVMCVGEKISNPEDIGDIMREIVKGRKNLAIIAESTSNELIHALVKTKLEGHGVVVIRSNKVGNRKKEFIEDIAYLTNGTYLDSMSVPKHDWNIEKLGMASQVIVDEQECIIIPKSDEDTKESISKRVAQLSDEAAIDKTPKRRLEVLKERLSKLGEGVATILVGASTETEQKEKMLRIEDALNATKAAISEGIVAGGGIALMEVSNQMRELVKTLDRSDAHKVGMKILIEEGLLAPFRQICHNGGVNPESKMALIKEKGYGVDIKTGEIVDMVQAGIIDPTRVTRSVLENAVSVASTVITTEAGIARMSTKRKNNMEM